MTGVSTRPVAAEANALYAKRLETTYEVAAGHSDRIEQLVLGGDGIALDTEFPGKQNVDTVYFRPVPAEDKAKRKVAPDADFRIRTYPDTPESPAFLEFKDEVTDASGQVFKEKTRAIVDKGSHLRIMDGEAAADVFGIAGRDGEGLTVARRAIDLIDEQGLQPVMRGRYFRTTMTNVVPNAADPAVPVRVTLDRAITHTGIGPLSGTGQVMRGVDLLDVKVTGETPEWLASLIQRELDAGVLSVAKRGKGGTAVRALAELAPIFRRV